MIPIPFILGAKAAGGFIAKHWRTFVWIAVAVIVVLFVMSLGAGIERRRLQPKIDAANAKIAAIEAAHAAASAAALADKADTETQHAAQRQALVEHFQERIHANNAALDAALERVRSAARVRPLAPAAAAPAPCRDYEAGPEQLPQPHREFLVREAARADATAEQLGACQKYAVELHAVCSAPAD